jgi:alpha-ketoglutarate-dependent taurine dioxygenase
MLASKDWREDVRLRGYAVLDNVSPESLTPQLGRRVGGVETLTPRDRDVAAPWSLSGAYGTGAFPWHTDGAVSTNPPRWILLFGTRVSGRTCTELLDPPPGLQLKLRRTVLRVVDRRGLVRHLPASMPAEDGVRLRWDPRICTPLTGTLLEEVDRHAPSVEVPWRVGRLLVVDNFRLLHRRPTVSGIAERILERTYVWSD